MKKALVHMTLIEGLKELEVLGHSVFAMHP